MLRSPIWRVPPKGWRDDGWTQKTDNKDGQEAQLGIKEIICRMIRDKLQILLKRHQELLDNVCLGGKKASLVSTTKKTAESSERSVAQI